MFLVSGSRATESSIRSASMRCSLPSASVYITATPPSVGSTPPTFALVKIFTPRRVIARCSSALTSSSSRFTMRGSASRIVTSVPNAVIGGAHLDADHAAADDDQLLGLLLERQNAGARQDAVFVDRGERQRPGLPAGSDHDVFGIDALLAAFGLHQHLVRAFELAEATVHIDLVFLHQAADAARHLLDYTLLVAHQSRPFEPDIVGHQPDALAVAGFLK